MLCSILVGGLLIVSTQCKQIEITIPPELAVENTSEAIVEPNKVELWATAIGKHESGNFKHCPYTCEVSHNYWGRKTISGGYAKWSSEEEAWENQKQYLQRRIDQGYDTLEKLGPLYAEDPNWASKVRGYLWK